MANILHSIKRKTLSNISEGIKGFHAKRGNIITGEIPVEEFRDALIYGVVKTNEPLATLELYATELDVFRDLADAARDIEGSENKILIELLGKRIFELLERLDAPSIVLKDVTFVPEQVEGLRSLNAPSILISGIEFIKEDEDASTVLDRPQILLVDLEFVSDVSQSEEQLKSPTISTFEIAFKEYGDVEYIRLREPSIVIASAVYSEDEKETSVQLTAPCLGVVEVVYEKEKQEAYVISSPEINLYDIEKVNEPQDKIKSLSISRIGIINVYTEVEEEPESVELKATDIDVVEITLVSDDGEQTHRLGKPNISVKSITYVKEVEERARLDEPSISLMYVEFTKEVVEESVQLVAPICKIEHIDVDFGITDENVQLKRLDISLVDISFIVENDYSLPLDEPVIQLEDINYQEVSKNFNLESPEIFVGNISYTSPPKDNVTQLKYTEIQIAYFWFDAEKVDGRLSAPDIETTEIRLLDNTGAVLGSAILGIAILGTK